ncbi:MAG: asparagine synthase (glutamine-hydrolyzing) [Betaproteobacteria bacterium]|nr:asparagine synthase (glutamine-hydrolyzing) [Betaproteobacteria bacterium]
MYGKHADVGEQDGQSAAAMVATLKHRGPDEQTLVRFGRAWLGHARLSIIDLETGTQPVYNETESVAVILNGEIYNYRELRSALVNRGHTFRTASDTEVLAHLYEDHGEDLFRHLNGMFAAVIYDRERDLLLAGRDRLGEKPILYLETPEHLVLASELKALLEWPGVPRELDSQALALYFNMLCVPEPLCIFRGIRKLAPSHYLKVERDRVEEKCYWKPEIRVDWSLRAEVARETVSELLRDSVAMRMVADVPVGVFLSGGIDSSAVTSFAAQATATPLRTFSVGLAGDMDERPFARAVAERCGTDHTELFVRGDVAESFPLVMDYFDEPFADSSCVPTYMVAREARAHVKVALTGDGGDELFAGYTTYLYQAQVRGGRIATRLARMVADATGYTTAYPRRGSPWAREHWRNVRSLVPATEMSRWLPGYAADVGRYYDENAWLALADSDPLSAAFGHYLNFYLPGDLLKKVDMAAMLASLECRAPFLDHRLVEFCLTIPPQLKIQGGTPKQLLKDAMVDRLPHEVLHRPKHGFGAPVADWVRGPLREIARDLIRPGCRCEALVEPVVVRRVADEMWREDAPSGWRLPQQYWSLLALEWWLRRYA